MSKLKEDDELEFDLRTSKDCKIILLKITAPHEMNNQDLIWALQFYTEQLEKREEIKRMGIAEC